MRILMLHQHFKLPEQGGGIRSYHMACALARAGHEVCVFAGGSRREKTTFAAGATVEYLNVPYSNEFPFLRRIVSFLAFYFKSIKQLSRVEPYDVVYAISTPLSVGWLGLQLKRKWRCKMVFEVGDLWPLAPIQMGVIRNSFLSRYLFNREAEIYRYSDVIISLSPDITSYIREKAPTATLHTIPNLADTIFFERAIKTTAGEKFTVGYFGAFGLANQLEYLLEAAKESKKQNLPVAFILMGEGMRLAKIKQEAKEAMLDNITFVPPANKEGVLAQMIKCDAIYISFKKLPVLATGSPNKFFDGIAAGKIIICNFEGWLGEEVRTHDIGFTYDPEQPDQFCRRLQKYIQNSSAIQAVRVSALKLAHEKYKLETLVTHVVAIIDKLEEEK